MDCCKVISLIMFALAMLDTVAGRAVRDESPVVSRLLASHRLGLSHDRVKRHGDHNSPRSHHHKHHHRGRCPPPPERLSDDACYQAICKSDSECSGDNLSCCFNGCMYTCMNGVMPPPVVDWIKEPTRQRYSGFSWLVSGPEEPLSEETCSTTVFRDGSMEPGCPTGFVCFIQDAGDPAREIPNRGICIKER